MWKVLGEETVAVNVGNTWEKRILELSKRRKDRERFQKLMGQANLRYYFDAIREIHTFMLRFPPSVPVEDLAFLRDFILKLHSAAKAPVVEFEEDPQKFTIVFTSDEDVDDHKKRNKWWETEEKEETQSV